MRVDNKPSMPTLSLVIPVYNSAEILPELSAQLYAVLNDIAEEFEVIFINDSSPDDSWRVIKALSAKYPWVSGINLMRNFGQHNALLCGIRAAKYDLIVTMDDDLQHPPCEIPRLLAKLQEGYDVVYGTPEREQHSLWRALASRATKFAMQSALNIDGLCDISAFRIFRTRLRNAFAHYHSPYVSIDALLTWGTTRFAALPVEHQPRHAGISNYTFRKLATHAINMLTGFSTLPLRLASWLGFAFTLFGVVVLIYVVGRYLIEGGSVQGFPFTASVIAIFSGVQLFVLGIIGEYLARIYLQSLGRPSYAVRTRTEDDDANE